MLFFVTVARDEFEFVVEAKDEADVRAACSGEDFDKWGVDEAWKVVGISPVKRECKPDITVTDGQFGEWQGE